MKHIRKLIIGILIISAIFGLTYLLGVFAEASFNIYNWNKDIREFTAVFGGIFSIGVGGILTGILYDDL